MIDYQLAHNLYCFVKGIKDTDEFLNAPKILRLLDGIEPGQRVQLKMFLRNRHLVLKENMPPKALAALEKELEKAGGLKDVILTNIEREREFFWQENRELQHRLRAMAKLLPKPETGDGETSVEDLGISRRTTNALLRAGFITVNDILTMNPNKTSRLRQFGKSCVLELKMALMELGFDEIDETKFYQDIGSDKTKQ